MFPRAAMVRCATLIVKVLGMYWRKTGTSHYHGQLRHPGKSRAVNVCMSVGYYLMIIHKTSTSVDYYKW